MIHHESQFGLIFRSWWRSQPASVKRGSFELKDTRGKDYFDLSELGKHQIDSGLAGESTTGNLIRVESGTTGTADYIGLVEHPSFVVVKFPNVFYVIPMKRINAIHHKRVNESIIKKISIHCITLSP